MLHKSNKKRLTKINRFAILETVRKQGDPQMQGPTQKCKKGRSQGIRSGFARPGLSQTQEGAQHGKLD